jgi:hypothetical protein
MVRGRGADLQTCLGIKLNVVKFLDVFNINQVVSSQQSLPHYDQKRLSPADHLALILVLFKHGECFLKRAGFKVRKIVYHPSLLSTNSSTLEIQLAEWEGTLDIKNLPLPAPSARR